MDNWAISKPIRNKKQENKYPRPIYSRILQKKFLYKVLYGVGYLGYFIGCLYQSSSFLSIYFQYPTTIEINILQEPIITFPAVTICNGNKVRQNKWCEMDAIACQSVPKGNKEAELFMEKLDKAYNYINRTIRIKLAHQKNDFIRSCQFEDRSCLNLIGQFYDYEYTNCFTVNSLWANKSMKPLSSSMFNPRTGRASELLLMLFVGKEEYSPLSPVVRARMTIHSPSTLPNPYYDAVSLQPGRTYNYGVAKNIINVLPRPYQTNCKNYTGMKELRTNATLTQEDCMSECCATNHLKYCTCTVQRLAFIYNIRTCSDPEEFECLKGVDEKVKSLCYPKCRMPCSKVTYAYKSVDSSALQKGSCSDNIQSNRSFSDTDRNNLICLRVYYLSPESEIYSYKPKYNGIQVFSIIGGYIGLWLGISFLDVHTRLMKGFLYYGKKREIQDIVAKDNN